MKKGSFNISRSTILLTGGTGSFGTAFIKYLLSSNQFKGIIRIFSRNETKQLAIQEQFKDDPRLRYLIGDVRDLDRLIMASRGADLVIHAAVLRQVSTLEYNPFEAINTNVLGTEHVIRAAINTSVKRAVFISSEKACSPIHLSGATQLLAEMLFIQSNFYTNGTPRLSVIRYSNALDNIGNVIPGFHRRKFSKTISISDKDSSKFWMTPNQGVQFVRSMIEKMTGGEIFVPKIPSVKIAEVTKIIAPKSTIKVVGLKPGDVLFETLITLDEMKRTVEYKRHFSIHPGSPFWTALKKIPRLRSDQYNSSNNNLLLTGETLREALLI